MVTLKQIHQAIKEKQQGLNADIETLIKISKENEERETNHTLLEMYKQREINKAFKDLGIPLL